MKDKILVIGGYGQVGKIICKQLVASFPGKVVAAGRNFDKAKMFADSMNHQVIPLQLDITNRSSVERALTETQLAMMCLDHEDTAFVKACIEHKTHYIDISPSYQTLARIEGLSDRAFQNDVTLMLGVGLAPGLSNLLVKHLVSQSKHIESVDIFLMLGVGERHGRDGVEWLLRNLNRDFSIVENKVERRIQSFSDKRTVLFPGSLGHRSAYRFDLADQHIVPKTLGLENVATRFCYDSAFVTTEIAVLKRLGIFSLLKYPRMYAFFVAMFEGLLDTFAKLKIGSEVYAIQVEAKDAKGIHRAALMGENNTQVTALVAALAVEKISAKPCARGALYLEQLFEFDELLERLKPTIQFFTD